MAGITAALAAWVARTPPIRRKAALTLAKDAMKDIVACMVGGADDPAVIAAANAAKLKKTTIRPRNPRTIRAEVRRCTHTACRKSCS